MLHNSEVEYPQVSLSRKGQNWVKAGLTKFGAQLATNTLSFQWKKAEAIYLNPF